MGLILWLVAALAPPAVAAWAILRAIPAPAPGRIAVATGYGIALGTFTAPVVLWALGSSPIGLSLLAAMFVSVGAWLAIGGTARRRRRRRRGPSHATESGLTDAVADMRPNAFPRAPTSGSVNAIRSGPVDANGVPSGPTNPHAVPSEPTAAAPATGGWSADASLASDLRLPSLDTVALTVFGGLIAAHALLIAIEVFETPLYPWDAWAQWATKARVWSELHALVPFVTPEQWLTGVPQGAFTDSAPEYPPLVPLLQAWLALALGGWSERLVNLPWLLLWCALVLATYGQARVWGLRRAWAAFAAYAVGSLPFVNAHAMLAGYADLPQAVIYALAAMALVAWSRGRSRVQLTLALACALLLPFVKRPGILWLATLAVVPLLAFFPRRGVRVLGAAAAAGFLLLIWLAHATPTVFGYRLDMRFEPQWTTLAQNLFLFGNWGIAFYVLLAAVLLGWRQAIGNALRPLSALVAIGAAALAVILLFTSARVWVEDQSTLNRAVLHWAPLATFYAFVVLASVRLPGAARGVPPEDAR